MGNELTVDQYMLLRSLDEVETQSILIMARSMSAGETHKEAAEKAAQYLSQAGRKAQAEAIRAVVEHWALEQEAVE